MKVLAVNGSARKDGNTAILLKEVIKELEKEGVETELIQLSGKRILPCNACYKCRETLDRKCVIKTDEVNDWIEKVLDAEGLLLGSPTYYADMTPNLKCFIDRVGFVTRGNGSLLKGKVGAAVVAVRRGGAINVFDSINHMFLVSEMIVPGSKYWNMGFGLYKGDVVEDEEGMETMRVLGQNMSYLMKKLF